MYTGSDGTLTDVHVGEGIYTFEPKEHFNGQVVQTFLVIDGKGANSYSEITITVNPINYAPIAASPSFPMNENSILTLTEAQLLAGASDVDRDQLSVDSLSYIGSDGTLTDIGEEAKYLYPTRARREKFIFLSLR